MHVCTKVLCRWLSNNNHGDLLLYKLTQPFYAMGTQCSKRRAEEWEHTKLSPFAVVYAVSSEQFTRIITSDRTFPSLEPTCLFLWQVNKGQYRSQRGQWVTLGRWH